MCKYGGLRIWHLTNAQIWRHPDSISLQSAHPEVSGFDHSVKARIWSVRIHCLITCADPEDIWGTQYLGCEVWSNVRIMGGSSALTILEVARILHQFNLYRSKALRNWSVSNSTNPDGPNLYCGKMFILGHHLHCTVEDCALSETSESAQCACDAPFDWRCELSEVSASFPSS